MTDLLILHEKHEAADSPGWKAVLRMMHDLRVPKPWTFLSVISTRNLRKIDEAFGPKTTAAHRSPVAAGKYLQAPFAKDLEIMEAEIARRKPKCILACGALAAWALMKEYRLRRIRGTIHWSESRQCKFIPTFALQDLIIQWNLRPILMADMSKAIFESGFPEFRRPSRELWIEPTLEDLYEFQRLHMPLGSTLSVDIETKAGTITEVGIAPSPDRALVIPFYSRLTGNYWPTHAAEREAWGFLRGVLTNPDYLIGGQNFLYDVQYLYRMGIFVNSRWDTMLKHHAAQPEMQKGLGFLASIYTREPSWKFMRNDQGTLKRED